MRPLSLIQFCFIITAVRSNCTGHYNHNENYSEAEPDCNCLTADDSRSDCDHNKKESSTKTTTKTLEYQAIPRRRKDSNTISPSPTATTVQVLEKVENTVNESSNDSEDAEQNTTASSATEYMEEFTNTIPHTADRKNWTYQGNKSSEESDEAKSTLIDYPFSVSIQRKGVHYTTGALLDKWWVITAAGEFYNVRDSLKLFRARLGSVDCKRGGSVVPLKKVELHPYYIYGKPNFDVAMLKMAYFIDFSDFIRPIAISTVKGKVLSAKFMTTYWPRILVKGSLLPKTASERIKHNSMRVSTQRLIPQDKCIKMIKSLNEVLNESTLCLKSVLSHHSACIPDPGAPVVAEDGLWGITSGWTSAKCPEETAPTVFTRLSSPPVQSWLNTVLLT